MPEQEPQQYNFWWPTSEKGDMSMRFALLILGVIGLIMALVDLGPGGSSFGVMLAIIFGGGANVVGWYVLITLGRFVYTRINQSRISPARREKAELVSLRRKVEIKKLREELGEDDAGEG